MNKRSDFENFEITQLSITAFKDGSVFVLLDKNGQKIGRLRIDAVGNPRLITMKRMLWETWSKWSQLELLGREQQRVAYQNDPWATKAETWAASLRIRERWSRNCKRTAKGNRFFCAEKRSTWDKAFDCLAQQLLNARRCAFVSRERDAWNHWADTCGKNHRRKDIARRRNGDARSAESRQKRACLFG